MIEESRDTVHFAFQAPEITLKAGIYAEGTLCLLVNLRPCECLWDARYWRNAWHITFKMLPFATKEKTFDDLREHMRQIVDKHLWEQIGAPHAAKFREPFL